jgi:hypothetical protein
MTPKKFLIATSFAVAAVAFIVAWQKARSIRENEDLRLGAAQRQAIAQREIQQLEKRLAAGERIAADLQAALDESKKKPAATAASAAGKPGMPEGSRPSPTEVIMQDPKLQNAFFAAQRAAIATGYGPFFQQLGLSPAQIAKFEDIMIKRAELDLDVRSVAQSKRSSPDSPEVAALRQQANDEVNAAQSELLGAEGFERWREYERSTIVRGMVEKFAGAMVLEAAPLTAHQAEQVTQILSAASARYARGDKADLLDIDWTAADQRLAGVLSPAQLALFRQIEPSGGGPSRFGARLDSALEAAIRAEEKDPPSAAKRPGG